VASLSGKVRWSGGLVGPRWRSTGPVTAAAVGELAGGRPVGVTGDATGHLQWWDLDGGGPIGEPVAGHAGAVLSLAITTIDDRSRALVTVGEDRLVRLWRVAEDGRTDPVAQAEPGATPRWVTAVQAADGRQVAVTSVTVPLDGTDRDEVVLVVWDVADGRRIGDPWHVGVWPAPGPLTAALLPDGRVAVVGGAGEGRVHVWDLAARSLIGTIAAHAGAVTALTADVLPDGRVVVVSGSRDRTASGWDLTTGWPLGEPFTGHTGELSAVATLPAPDGLTVLSAGTEDRVRAWDVITAEPLGEPHQPHPDRIGAMAATVLADGRAVVISGDRGGEVRVWEPFAGGAVTPLGEGHTASIEAIAFSPGDDVAGDEPALVTASMDGSARLWDLTSGRPSGEILPDAGGLTAVAVATTPDGRRLLLTGGEDGTVSAWDRASLVRVSGPVRAVAGRLVRSLATVTLPDGRPILISGGNDGRLRRWTLPGLEAVGDPLVGHTRPIVALQSVTLPDGGALAVSLAQDDAVRRWDVVAGTGLGELEPARGASQLALAASPDGPVLVTGHPSGAVRCWDPISGRRRWDVWHGNGEPVAAVAVAVPPGGCPVAVSVGAQDRTVRWWSLDDGRPLAQGGPVPHPVGCLTAARGGTGPVLIAAGDGLTALELG
jgi:WD40 repeat protein